MLPNCIYLSTLRQGAVVVLPVTPIVAVMEVVVMLYV